MERVVLSDVYGYDALSVDVVKQFYVIWSKDVLYFLDMIGRFTSKNDAVDADGGTCTSEVFQRQLFGELIDVYLHKAL